MLPEMEISFSLDLQSLILIFLTIPGVVLTGEFVCLFKILATVKFYLLNVINYYILCCVLFCRN